MARAKLHGAGRMSVGNKVKKPGWKAIGALVVAAIVVAGALYYWVAQRTPPARYVTSPVTTGDVATTITASGTINPVVTVQVGTFVSGVIQTLTCDYNTRVRKGQVCATIDPTPYQAVVDQDQAELGTARAQLDKDQANLDYEKVSSGRTASLLTRHFVSQDAADLALSAYNQARAQVSLDRAQIVQRLAALRAGQINLDYTKITSPVDGTVVSRNVNAGQTVAASFQTPTLFLIATDLTKMQVDTNVSESDIAGAVQGASASFTVDAYPKRAFPGQVAQVRQAPISVQNVITYDVVIAVANPGLLLKPGMTATARITTAQAVNVLRVPSQALRFTPVTATQFPKVAGAGKDVVWVQRSGALVAVPVTVGLNDNTYAEITSGGLKQGDPVVVSESATGAAGNAKTAATPSLHLH